MDQTGVRMCVFEDGAHLHFKWALREMYTYTQRNIFGILLHQTEIKLYLSFSDWFGTERTSVWLKINRKLDNTIWFRFDLIRFRKDFSVWRGINAIFSSWNSPKKMGVSGGRCRTNIFFFSQDFEFSWILFFNHKKLLFLRFIQNFCKNMSTNL